MRALAVLAAIILALAGTVQAVISHRARGGWRKLSAGMAPELDRGGLHGLQRARLVAVRVALSEPHDPDNGALLAYLCARLSLGYGLPFEQQAEEAGVRAVQGAARGAPAARVSAARALLALRHGDRARAISLATAGTAGGAAVEPWLALALARAWSGDTAGAGRALEAARVLAPGSGDARRAWAEVRLDLGDAAGAAEALRRLPTGPDDTEARLLEWQVADAQGRVLDPAAREALVTGCRRDAAISSVIAAGCALAAATHARLEGDTRGALEQARRAVRAAHPRLQARGAQLLAQLGHVDEADAALAGARRLADESMPALAWARVAVTLGRGQVANPPHSLAPAGALDRLVGARAAFAASGPRGLEAWVAGEAPPTDPDLRLYRAFLRPDFSRQALGPLGAYLSGLRARLDGDLPTAARFLTTALAGHADACRAAGEWAATLVALGAAVDDAALTPLREVNAGCVNLSALPPATKNRR